MQSREGQFDSSVMRP
nr:unnamed protein product [Callosobruchus chinensis]